ncbi:GGDEF domain-containing protein [Roseibium sp. SCP14]|uniref:GGDEF domain-containing protein n=1 Tax=Roseibium sp. SCP14 TaxID=3141375 RepID=UPI003339AD45
MTLDTPTLFTCLMIAELAGSAVLLLFFLFWKPRGGACSQSLLLWASGLFCIGCGTALLAMRGEISDTLSIIVANVFVVAGVGLRRSGLATFLKTPSYPWLIVIPAAAWTVLCFYSPFRESLIARVNYLYFFFLLNGLWIVWMAFRENREKLLSVKLLGLSMLLECCAFVWFTLNQNLHDFPTFLSAFPENFMTIYLVTLLFSNIMTIVLPACMVIERNLQRFKEQALQDPLTGLPNRRAFLDDAEAWVSRNSAEKKTYSIIALELDGFDTVRDTFGNAMGDAVLQLFGRVLKDSVGETAVLGRIVGEQFVVFLPKSDREFAALTAQRICRKFGVACQEASEGKLLVTASVGLLTTHTGVGLDRAVEVADRGLSQAKQQGRAQVVAMDLSPGGGAVKNPGKAGFSFLRKKVA